jgi:hypothetical protein
MWKMCVFIDKIKKKRLADRKLILIDFDWGFEPQEYDFLNITTSNYPLIYIELTFAFAFIFHKFSLSEKKC